MTVEEKANKYAEEAILALYSDSELMQDFVQKQKKYAKVDFLAGYRKGQSNPKIKQLEWRGDVAHRIKTNTSIGEYEVYKSINGDYYFYIDGIKATTFTFNSLEKAKAFAQADFEERVKECLIIE